MSLKVLSVKWRPFRLGLNVLTKQCLNRPETSRSSRNVVVPSAFIFKQKYVGFCPSFSNRVPFSKSCRVLRLQVFILEFTKKMVQDPNFSDRTHFLRAVGSHFSNSRHKPCSSLSLFKAITFGKWNLTAMVTIIPDLNFSVKHNVWYRLNNVENREGSRNGLKIEIIPAWLHVSIFHPNAFYILDNGHYDNCWLTLISTITGSHISTLTYRINQMEIWKMWCYFQNWQRLCWFCV